MIAIESGPFEGWYFYEDYFCSPAGDRFLADVILACHFVRQMQDFRDVMYSAPLDRLDDAVFPIRRQPGEGAFEIIVEDMIIQNSPFMLPCESEIEDRSSSLCIGY